MANEIEQIDPSTGEVMTMIETNSGGTSLAVQLAQAELNQAVVTARAFPRADRKGGLGAIVNSIMTLATLDEQSAEESIYALPRGGKPIKGPSIRFAEIVASQWGNCHTGSRVVAVDRFDKVVIAEGVFLDLETGMKRTAQIRRRIVDKRGNLFNDDMIVVTGNAASSIAMREAILKGIPKAIWRKAYDRCESVVAGDIQTLNVRRENAIKAFAVWGVKPEQIFAALELGGVDDIGLDQLATLLSMHKAIKSEEQKVEDYFPAHSNGEKAVEAAKGTAAKLGNIAEQGKADTKSADTKAPADEKATAKGKDKKTDAKVETDKPVKTKDQVQTEGEQTTAGDEPQVEGQKAERTFTDDDLEAAFKRGEEAKNKGMSRKALPPEWRDEGFEPLADSWVKGFNGE